MLDILFSVFLDVILLVAAEIQVDFMRVLLVGVCHVDHLKCGIFLKRLFPMTPSLDCRFSIRPIFLIHGIRDS